MSKRHISVLWLLLPLFGACGTAAESDSRIIVTAPMPMPGLERERSLRIYLPPGYDAGRRRYPVIYLHDGQNLYDEATAYAGEWQVDETLDRLAGNGGPALIAVGIDNGGEARLSEMAPWSHQDYGAAQADAYLDFIVETVKPYVDANFRTLADREHTGMLGSSMGALVSHYAAWRHADTFSRIGLFSPSYWWSENIYSMTASADACPPSRFYLLVGGSEQAVMLEGAERMHRLLGERGCPAVNFDRVADGEHNEALWRGRFETAIRWLYGNGEAE